MTLAPSRACPVGGAPSPQRPAATDSPHLPHWSPSYLIELFAGAVCFIIASASFVFSVALDVKQMEEQNEEVRAQRRG